MKAPISTHEAARLQALKQYRVLDTAPEKVFDELTQQAAQVCQTPMAALTFIDENRQWHKSNVGVEATEMAREISFCAHTITGVDALVVTDATKDERFRDNPLVTGESGLRFYAGVPLVTPDGFNVGSLCAFDTVARDIQPQQLEELRTLGHQVVAQLEMRLEFSPTDSTAALHPRNQHWSERGQAAESLRAANARYLALFESTREGVLLVDSQSGLIEQANGFLIEMLGVATKSNVIGRYLWQIAALQPLFPDPFQWETLGQTLKDNGTIRVPEIALKTADNRELWVEFRAQLSDTMGRAMVSCNLHEITQSKLDRQALRAQQHHNNMLLQMSLNAIVMMNADGQITEWNPAAETMFGRAHAQVIGCDLATIIVPPALRQSHRGAFARHLRNGQSSILGQRVEVSALRADGREFPVELTITRDDSDSGAGPSFIAFLRDISSRKRVEAAMLRANDELELHVMERTAQLSETNEQLQNEIARRQRAQERLAATAQRLNNVLESISDAFVTLDFNWHFTYANDQALLLMDKTRDQLLGCKVCEGFPGARDFFFSDKFQHAICDGQSVTLDYYFAPQKIWLEIHAYPSEEGLSIYFQDISARRADQFALEAAKREADAANAAKSEFLGRISHELRTPLNAILGFGQILDSQDLTPPQAESVGYILKSGNHLLELINEVLDISCVESGHIELNLAPVALADAILDACALVRPLADARSIALRVAPARDEAEAPHICADGQRFAQVMINLLSNAIKYNFENGEVEVSWRKHSADRWQVSVRDSGPGISPKNLPRLFVPFERGAAANSEVEGTGLGLSLTLSLVEAMGGTITVESAPGRGSVFAFDLPSAQAPADRVALAPPPGAATPTGAATPCAYRVLCIEDDASNLRLIELVLATRPEIALISARNAAEGLKLARGHEPDLILLDLNLPDMHGSQVLTRLQQSALTRDIPVIVISADATKTQIEELLDHGATHYLTKPLDMRCFLKTLDKILSPTG